jgi:hypothetical protein
MSDHDRRWRTVVAMIAERRKVDPALKGTEHPREWIGAAIWPSPEYLIYTILRGLALLERDGMTQADALRQVDARLRLNVLAADAGATPPAEYVEMALRNVAPGYLDLGPALLTKAIGRAQRGLRTLPEDGVWTTPNGLPPADWEWRKIPKVEARRQFEKWERQLRRVPVSMHDEDLADLVIRRQPGDQLYTWSSPTLAWRLSMGRGGIALVRDGRVLCDVTTMMN